jgi:hypothetical protein
MCTVLGGVLQQGALYCFDFSTDAPHMGAFGLVRKRLRVATNSIHQRRLNAFCLLEVGLRVLPVLFAHKPDPVGVANAVRCQRVALARLVVGVRIRGELPQDARFGHCPVGNCLVGPSKGSAVRVLDNRVALLESRCREFDLGPAQQPRQRMPLESAMVMKRAASLVNRHGMATDKTHARMSGHGVGPGGGFDSIRTPSRGSGREFEVQRHSYSSSNRERSRGHRDDVCGRWSGWQWAPRLTRNMWSGQPACGSATARQDCVSIGYGRDHS